MNKEEFMHEYNREIDILHIYSISNEKIKGCISLGDYNLDVGYDNKILGVEIEEASKVLNVSEEILESLDKVSLIFRKVGNSLLIGFAMSKKNQNFQFQFAVPSQNFGLKAVH